METLVVLSGGPFQWVSAVEAINSYSLNPRAACLYTTPHAAGSPPLNGLTWGRVVTRKYYSPTQPGAVRRHAVLSRFVRDVMHTGRGRSQVDTLMLGHLGKPMQAIANMVRAKRVVILDDGTAVVKAFRHREEHDIGEASFMRLVHQQAYSSVYGARPDYRSGVEYFTIFDLEPTRVGDSAVRHRFKHLRRSLHAEVRDECVVLGTPAVSSGMVALESYAECLNRVASRLRLPTVYRQHHSETAHDLAAVPSDWQIARPRWPLEVDLVSKALPSAIVGWASTGLVSAKVIVGDALQVFRVEMPTSVVAARYRSKIGDCEDLISSFGIPTI